MTCSLSITCYVACKWCWDHRFCHGLIAKRAENRARRVEEGPLARLLLWEFSCRYPELQIHNYNFVDDAIAKDKQRIYRSRAFPQFFFTVKNAPFASFTTFIQRIFANFKYTLSKCIEFAIYISRIYHVLKSSYLPRILK